MISRLSQLDQRQRNLAAIGLLSIVLAAMVMYVVMPQVKSFRAHSVSRNALLDVAAGGSELTHEIDKRMTTIDELTRVLHGDSGNLPLKEMEAFVIGRLQKICWDNEVELVSVAPDDGEQIDRFHEILFRVELEGGYRSIYQWLAAVRGELGFVVIKEFSLNRIDQEAVDPVLRANLTLASYRQAGT